MDKSFTSKQKEIVARKMGYDGPMQGFDDFLASSPSDAQKYSAITSKFVERMAKGGVVSKSPVRKYAPGGDVTAEDDTTTAPPVNDAKPVAPVATSYTAAQTATPTAAAVDEAGDTTDATVTKVDDTDVKTVDTPTAVKADTITADTAQTKVETALDTLSAETGTVSESAKATAETQDPTTTAVSKVEAAQGTAATVAPVTDRTLQEGELISGSAVDMAEVDKTLDKTKAEQGTVTELSLIHI